MFIPLFNGRIMGKGGEHDTDSAHLLTAWVLLLKQTWGQAGIWIFHRQYPMMQAHVSEIVPRGETDFHVAEA